jgi:hypothetical protein
MTDAQLLHAAEFEARRRRALRAMGVLVLASVTGLGLAMAAHELAPELFEPAVMLFVVTFGATGLALWRTLRRHWRCPACDARWDSSDVLASAHWNHCATCGEPLRVSPIESTREQSAVARFDRDETPHEELLARFLRRRRLGMLAAGVVAIAGVATLVWVQHQGWGELGEQAVVALFGGMLAAVVVTGARCPRCRVGIVARAGRHCQRCGLVLRSEVSGAADRRTGT